MLSNAFFGGGSNGSENLLFEGFAPRNDPLARTLDVLAERLEPGATEPGGVFYRPDAIPLDEVAELAAMDTADELASSFVSVATRHFEVQGFLDLFDGPAVLGPWVVLVRWMAEFPGHHMSRSPLGQALAEAGVPEAEVSALSESRGSELRQRLRRALETICTCHRTLDFFDVARLLLADSDDGERLAVWSEIVDAYEAHRD